MKAQRWLSPCFAAAVRIYLLCSVYFLLGNKIGLALSLGEDQPRGTSTIKPVPKFTEAPENTPGVPIVTEAISPQTTSGGEVGEGTTGGSTRPRPVTAHPATDVEHGQSTTPFESTTQPTMASTVTGEPGVQATTPEPSVTTPSVTTPSVTTPSVTMPSLITPPHRGQTTVSISPSIATPAASTTPATTPTQRQHPTTQSSTTQVTPARSSQQTTQHQPPLPTEYQPTSRHPPVLPTRTQPTGEPHIPPTQGPPVETEKPPPPSKPHKPTRPRPTTGSHTTTTAGTIPTKAPTTCISGSTPTDQPQTPIPYPQVAIQLILQITWKDLCPDIENLLSSIVKYSEMSLALSYRPYVGLLNDTTSCKRGASQNEDSPIDAIRVQIDICMEILSGICDATLTENVGIQMQSDIEGLQKYLQPPILSVRVYKPLQATPGPHTTSPSATGVGVGLSLGFLITASFAAVVAYKMYRLRQSKRRAIHNRYYFDGKQLHDTLSESHQLSPLHHTTFSMPATVHHLVPAINKGLVMDDEGDFAAQRYPSHVLSMRGLSQFYSYLEAIIEEYETLPDSQGLSKSHSPSKSSLSSPNLFLPPPKTRVPLEKGSIGNQHCFLNASFVKGYGNDRYSYIATTSPWGTNLADFWEMVWEQQSRTIICLCAPEEMGVACPWYWPREEGIQAAQLYGDILVMRQGCVLTENYSLSTLLIKNIQKNLCRPINHFWFTQWPVVSNLVPSSPILVLSFLLQVRQTVQESYGPIVTHCSDGCGRTGTLLAIDSAMRSIEDLCTVDVPYIVSSIRHDRGAAVLQRDHYVFIYKALYEYSVMLTRGLADGITDDEEDNFDRDSSQNQSDA